MKFNMKKLTLLYMVLYFKILYSKMYVWLKIMFILVSLLKIFYKSDFIARRRRPFLRITPKRNKKNYKGVFFKSDLIKTMQVQYKV